MCKAATPRVGPGESKLQTRPLLRHASECFGNAGVAGRSCHPSLSLRGERPHVAHELLPSSRQSTGCATHLAHVNVCGLSLPVAPLAAPSICCTSFPCIRSLAPSILAYVLPSRSHVPRSLWPVSWQATEVQITETASDAAARATPSSHLRLTRRSHLRPKPRCSLRN